MNPAVTADLEVLAPASTSLSFAGQQVELLPLRAGKVPPLIRAVGPMLQSLFSNGIVSGEGDEVDVDLPALLTLIGDFGSDFFAALALVSGIEEERLENATIDDVVRLTQVCIRVNRDFFTRNVAPLLAGMAKQLPGAGPTPSNS